MAISTGVSTRKESKQSDQRLENLSSEQKQVYCNNGYESLITISGGKKAKPRYNKSYKYTYHGKVSFFFGDAQSYTMYQTLQLRNCRVSVRHFPWTLKFR